MPELSKSNGNTLPTRAGRRELLQSPRHCTSEDKVQNEAELSFLAVGADLKRQLFRLQRIHPPVGLIPKRYW